MVLLLVPLRIICCPKPALLLQKTGILRLYIQDSKHLVAANSNPEQAVGSKMSIAWREVVKPWVAVPLGN